MKTKLPLKDAEALALLMVDRLKPYCERLEYPPCPDCGTIGVYGWMESRIVDGRFAILDVYICPKCEPGQLERR